MLLVTMTTMIPANENETRDTEWAYGAVYDYLLVTESIIVTSYERDSL